MTENPKNIEFAELDAAQLPRSLAMSTRPLSTPITRSRPISTRRKTHAIESEKSPYANVIAVRSADKDAPWVKTLVESYHDDKIKAFIVEHFKGALIPSW